MACADAGWASRFSGHWIWRGDVTGEQALIGCHCDEVGTEMAAAAARSLRSRPLWEGDVGELDAFTFSRLLPSAGEEREDWGWDRWQSRSSLPAWHIRGLGWSLSPSLPGQANAQPAALATWMVARREVCLFCPVSCTNSCLSTCVNNSATAAGRWWGRGEPWDRAVWTAAWRP